MARTDTHAPWAVQVARYGKWDSTRPTGERMREDYARACFASHRQTARKIARRTERAECRQVVRAGKWDYLPTYASTRSGSARVRRVFAAWCD